MARHAPLDAPLDTFGLSSDYSNFLFSSQAPQTRSDAKGRFRLDGLPDKSRFTFWISHACCVQQIAFALTGNGGKPIEIEAGHSDSKIEFRAGPLRVEMERGYQVVASVVDHNDQPIEALETGLSGLA